MAGRPLDSRNPLPSGYGLKESPESPHCEVFQSRNPLPSGYGLKEKLEVGDSFLILVAILFPLDTV